MNDDVRARLDALERRQARLKQDVSGLEETIAALKDTILRGDSPSPQSPADSEPADFPPPPPVPVEPAESDTATPSAGPPPLPVPPAESSLEMKVGTVWLARIGIVIVLTGLVFLANYAWRSLMESFGAYAKLGLLYLAGGGLCAIGLALEKGRESLRRYAQILMAGGLAALYYTTYAAYYVPSLKVISSPLLAGALLISLAGMIGWMADRRHSQFMAGLAVLLAFYASAINPLTSFTLLSNAILGTATVVLMVRKRWMVLPFLALAATYGSYIHWQVTGIWQLREFPAAHLSDLATRLTFLSVYWCIFTAGAFLVNGPGISAAVRVVFSTLNDAAFFCLAAIAVTSRGNDSLWVVALVFGLVQLALSLTARTAFGSGSAPGAAWLAKALFFLTLALLTRFTGNSLAIILAVESSLLVFAARQLPSPVLAASGPIAGVLATLAGMVSLSEAGGAGAAGVVAALLAANAWLCTCAKRITPGSMVLSLSGVVMGCLAVIDWLPDAWDPAGPAGLGFLLVCLLPFHKSRELAFAGLLGSLGAILLQCSSFESAGRWPSLAAIGLLAATAVTGPMTGKSEPLIKIPAGILAILSALLFWAWLAVYVPESHRFWLMSLSALAVLGLSRGKPLGQAVAILLTAAALFLFWGHGFGSQARYTPFDLLGCLLLFAQERLSPLMRASIGSARFAGIAGLLTLVLWVTTALNFYHNPLPLTAAWALLALAVFFVGFLARARLYRLGGLGILAIALCKILLLDVWSLDLPVRILSFLILGSVLLLLGYLYNRYADRIRQWL